MKKMIAALLAVLMLCSGALAEGVEFLYPTLEGFAAEEADEGALYLAGPDGAALIVMISNDAGTVNQDSLILYPEDLGAFLKQDFVVGGMAASEADIEELGLIDGDSHTFLGFRINALGVGESYVYLTYNRAGGVCVFITAIGVTEADRMAFLKGFSLSE